MKSHASAQSGAEARGRLSPFAARGSTHPNLFLSFFVFAGILIPAHSVSAASLAESLSQGTVSANFRYRYEGVDQAGIAKKAQASTLRSVLGYETAPFKGVSAFLEFEDVSVVGDASYNDTANGKTQYPVVADPEDTEINQAFLKFKRDALTLKGGRQRIKLDNDRFIGNVGWRQNEQTFDAAALAFNPAESLTAAYIYIANVNRVFGEHHPVAASADTRMNAHLFHFAATGLPALNASAYAYLLDFEAAPAASIQTLGLRLKGAIPAGKALKMLYTAEYANQSDYADGAATNDADYFLGELGGSAMGATAIVGYEVLGGDGAYGFGTPLATVHAFQGWADKFLVTPPTGVRDLYFSLSGMAAGIKLAAIYHVFSSDSGGIDYGTEMDLLAVKALSSNTSVGIKYAGYQADSDPLNTGGTAVDTDKLWLMGELKF